MWIKFKNHLVATLLETLKAYGCEVDENSIWKCVDVKTNDEADVVISLLNPVYQCLYSKLDQIKEDLVKSSQQWSISLSNRQVTPQQDKWLKFHLNRESAIIECLRKSPFVLNSKSQQSCLILNLIKVKDEDWLYLRSKCFAEAFQKLTLLRHQRVDLKDDDDNNGGIKLTDTINSDNKSQNYDDYFNGLSIQANRTKVYRFLSLISFLAQQKYDEVYLISVPSDELAYNQAFEAYQTLNNLSNLNVRLHFISLATVKSAFSQKDFILKMGQMISEQNASVTSNSKYSEIVMKKLIDFNLRYLLLSVSPKKICQINFAKLKEAIFIQYNHARLCGILSKYKQDYGNYNSPNLQLLQNQADWNLIKFCILHTSSFLEEMSENCFTDIHQITSLLTKTVNKISSYYNSVRIITEVNDKTLPMIEARLLLISKLKDLLQNFIQNISCHAVDVM